MRKHNPKIEAGYKQHKARKSEFDQEFGPSAKKRKTATVNDATVLQDWFASATVNRRLRATL